MTPERYGRLSELFLAVRGLSAQEQSSFLQNLSDDASIRSELASLLECDRELTEFCPAVAVPPGSSAPQAGLGAGLRRSRPERIGRYAIRGLLGEGGMGIVYLADQENPSRTVALKVLRSGIASPAAIRRFEHETQALARLKHPGIAQIYEAGAGDDPDNCPFFAMELVDGLSLSEYIKRRRPEIRVLLSLFIEICRPVEHAHQKGVIHRDLKPGNILVPEDGHPKILDFGVARMTSAEVQPATEHTHAGQLIGTIPYMSPEQVAGDPYELDTRSDVYALGVILYEMLTGRLPHDLRQRAIPDAIRIIAEQDAVPIGTIDRALRGDLELIVGMAIEKDKNRRYSSVSEFAGDIERYLRNEPVTARPLTRWYRLRKFTRRHRPLVSGLAGVFLTLIAGLAATTWQAREADRRAADARREAEKARQIQEFLRSVLTSVDPQIAQGRDTTLLHEMLDDAARRIDIELVNQPAIASDLRDAIGTTFLSLGLAKDAEPHLRGALAIRERLYGPDDLLVAESLNNLAFLLDFNGDQAGAEELYRRSLDVRRRRLGATHPAVAASLNNVGLLLKDRGALEEAESTLREALRIRQGAVGPEHADVAQSWNNLGQILEARGQLEEAEDAYREAVNMRRKLHTGAHPALAISINNLASVLQTRGDFDAAESLYLEALDIDRRIADDFPHVEVVLNNLAALRFDRGDFAAAEPLFREVLDRTRRRFGDGHPNVLVAMNNLATTLRKSGDLDSAESIFRELLEANKRMFGEEHPDIALVLNGIADILRQKAEFAQAETTCREALAMRRKLLGDDHLDVAQSLHNLALIVRETEGYAAAEPFALESVDIYRRKLRTDHPNLAKGLLSLALILHKTQRDPQAESLYREAFTITRDAQPPRPRDVVESAKALATFLIDLNDHAGAEPLLQECLRIQTEFSPAGGEEIARTQSLLDDCLAKTGHVVGANANVPANSHDN